MRKFPHSSKDCCDAVVLDSLKTIEEAHVQLRLLAGTPATAALLASQIQLYDLVLDEISVISSGLARDLGRTGRKLQASGLPALNA